MQSLFQELWLDILLKMTNMPLEVRLKVSLEASKHFAKGEIISFEPGANDLESRDFLTGYNSRNLVLFASGSQIVLYDNKISYQKIVDKAFFEAEFNTPIRELVYKKQT